MQYCSAIWIWTRPAAACAIVRWHVPPCWQTVTSSRTCGHKDGLLQFSRAFPDNCYNGCSYNAAARLVFSARKSEHTPPLLRELQYTGWKFRRKFSSDYAFSHIVALTARRHLSETLHLTADVGSRRRLRSASTDVAGCTVHTTNHAG